MNIEQHDNKFRIVTQKFSTKWLPDNLWNRKVVLVMLRYLSSLAINLKQHKGNGKKNASARFRDSRF